MSTAVRQKKMNNSCFLSDVGVYISLTASLPISAFTVLTCLATVIFVCVLKLHKTLFYRLALYQVLSAMEFSVVWITAAASRLYPNSYYINGSTFSDLKESVARLLNTRRIQSPLLFTEGTYTFFKASSKSS